jgi:hypothetical protein
MFTFPSDFPYGKPNVYVVSPNPLKDYRGNDMAKQGCSRRYNEANFSRDLQLIM